MAAAQPQVDNPGNTPNATQPTNAETDGTAEDAAGINPLLIIMIVMICLFAGAGAAVAVIYIKRKKEA